MGGARERRGGGGSCLKTGKFVAFIAHPKAKNISAAGGFAPLTP